MFIRLNTVIGTVLLVAVSALVGMERPPDSKSTTIYFARHTESVRETPDEIIQMIENAKKARAAQEFELLGDRLPGAMARAFETMQKMDPFNNRPPFGMGEPSVVLDPDDMPPTEAAAEPVQATG